MYYIVYETTNKLNERKYRGAHQTENINDDYLGSGRLLIQAVEKYGKENFERKILAECSNSEEMFEIEKDLVNEDWVADPKSYNLKIGGEGGWSYINARPWSKERLRQHSITIKKL